MTRLRKRLLKSGPRGSRVGSKKLHSSHQKISNGIYGPTERKLWEASRCSVCMEFPHNAVLLLCSSYHKGCRPYMCATSDRFSNCLDQYKKAYTKVTATQNAQLGSMNTSKLGDDISHGEMEVAELLCPLCRGEVKGWTVVDAARNYLDSKKRPCMHDKCSYVGNYRQLRKHVRTRHGSANPLQVDPALKAKWKHLESERERADVISTITSSTPGAIVMGDYVIENDYNYMYSDDPDDSYINSDSFDEGFYRRRGRAFGTRRISDGQHNVLSLPRYRRFFNSRNGWRSRGIREYEWDM